MYYRIVDFIYSGSTSKNKINLLKKVYDEVITEVKILIDLKNIPSLNIVNERYLDEGAISNYYQSIISIDGKILTNKKLNEIKEALTHELGHYIHENYFNYDFINFTEEDKTEYAYTDYKEDFAECFTDLFYRGKNNKRTEEMEKLLGCI